ncbi:hypothetical protein [uncultured Thiothrix sp.]|uniref:hypothetical protein n=1 Tax=uncultured Thiothrix sp. TaxID=223185 RepID=UPI002637B181|nr:hypothetical protein [uncultured Thiothrix sp.]
MEAMTTIGALAAWAWPVMSTMSEGIASNAAYDALKALLGGRYQAYAEQGKEELFKEVLSSVLEHDQALLEKLTALAAKHPHRATTTTITNKVVGNITTRDITAGRDVRIGNSIEVKRDEETD